MWAVSCKGLIEEKAQHFINLGADVNMILMGSVDNKNYRLAWWSLENGASPTFSVQATRLQPSTIGVFLPPGTRQFFDC